MPKRQRCYTLSIHSHPMDASLKSSVIETLASRLDSLRNYATSLVSSKTYPWPTICELTDRWNEPMSGWNNIYGFGKIMGQTQRYAQVSGGGSGVARRAPFMYQPPKGKACALKTWPFQGCPGDVSCQLSSWASHTVEHPSCLSHRPSHTLLWTSHTWVQLSAPTTQIGGQRRRIRSWEDSRLAALWQETKIAVLGQIKRVSRLGEPMGWLQWCIHW